MSAWQHDLDLLAALDAGVPLKVVARSSVDQEAVMAKSTIVGSPLLSSALAGAAALALFSAPFAIGEAAAKVGVTSATDGDPLGKPPAEAERHHQRQ